jgi:hypothetical protein
MSSKIQQTVAPGIYRLGSGGFRVKVAVGDRKRGGHQRETTFPPNTGLREMKAWQTQERARLLRQGLVPARGTLEADLPAYLSKMKRKLAHADSREDEINAWLDRFRNRRRHTITRDEVRRQVKDWEDTSVAASTIRHRMTPFPRSTTSWMATMPTTRQGCEEAEGTRAQAGLAPAAHHHRGPR